MTDITFVHTAEVHVATFGELAAAIAPEMDVQHVVAAHLLREAVRLGGVTAELGERVCGELLAAATATRLVVCTCSTLGPWAEVAARRSSTPITRIDRAMAEKAVESGARVLVAACLQTTLAPTTDLVRAVARQRRRDVEVDVLLLPEAWAHFERGDRDAYLDAIAAALTRAAGGADVILLAQASMAGAVARCGDLGVPVLSSPRLGVEAAVSLVRGLGTRG